MGIQCFKQMARLFHRYESSMCIICFYNRPLKTKLDSKKEENTGNSGKLQMMQNENSNAEETRVDSKGEVH